jgi:DNA-directed RNA polymerase specialized sigma24 family protein
MQTLKRANERAADLYWLAFLLTGQSETSIDAAVEAVDFQDEANAFFSSWMVAWSRRVVIAKALAAIRDELAASASRMASMRPEKQLLPPPERAFDGDMTNVQLERALLAIDVFPRCALLLSVFEKMPLEDAAILLDACLDLVRKAQRIGLRELTCKFAGMRESESIGTGSYVLTSVVQHD